MTVPTETTSGGSPHGRWPVSTDRVSLIVTCFAFLRAKTPSIQRAPRSERLLTLLEVVAGEYNHKQRNQGSKKWIHAD